ncbi:trehalose-phosphatase [Actinoallomurus purpureus]|uniref:trehalose-phosphatase n=1 Tax=Actinoallomurus purpureus TaxID=478114 RepID=UPI002092E069|nr:trehalose-phosphatase [Actinoallomurus purpureus]MCO6010888.1 trehalose-phosphatase [Actinoallomurus purpureus]
MSADALEAQTPAGAEGLSAISARPRHALIGFDFDGTLSPIVDDPEAARAHPGVVPALRRLAPLVGTVAVITGRPAATAVEHGGFADIEGLLVLGQYGRERWENGVLQTSEPPPGVAEVRAKLPLILANAPEGVTIEDKGLALAVHTRRAAEPQVVLERLRSIVAALAERTGLVVEPGRFVLELRPPGMDKGGALRGLVAERGASAVLFAGDDLGDLPAYDAIDALRKEGTPGVKVCSSSDEVTALAERADLIVDGPPGVVGLIERLASDLS